MPRKKSLTWRSLNYKHTLIVLGITLIILVSLLFVQNSDLLRTQVSSVVSPSASATPLATLTITNSNTEKGTVIDTETAEGSVPRGDKIHCGIKCAGEYPAKSTVTIYAHAERGNVFDKWVNVRNCSKCTRRGRGPECNVYVSANFPPECGITWKAAPTDPPPTDPPPTDPPPTPEPSESPIADGHARLKIKNTDVAKGTVTDTTEGSSNTINCGTKCQFDYRVDSELIMTAEPRTGFTPSWKNIVSCGSCADSTDEQCRILIIEAHEKTTIQCQIDWAAVSS